MKNIILCIGDPDQAYLERLNSYVQNRPGSPFAIRSFTKASPLKGCVCQQRDSSGHNSFAYGG